MDLSKLWQMLFGQGALKSAAAQGQPQQAPAPQGPPPSTDTSPLQKMIQDQMAAQEAAKKKQQVPPVAPPVAPGPRSDASPLINLMQQLYRS